MPSVPRLSDRSTDPRPVQLAGERIVEAIWPAWTDLLRCVVVAVREVKTTAHLSPLVEQLRSPNTAD